MDYQFIHSVARGAYVDLPSSRPVPGAYMADLRKYAGAGDGVESVPGGVYSYFTLRAGNESPIAFFSHIERKKNARYPCNFIQSAGWIVRDDLLLKAFDTILEQEFFTEDQVDGFVENGETPPLMGNGGRSLPAVSIQSEALRAVMFGCLHYWQTGTAPVCIAVPQEDSARYNEYVLGAVREIYSYFPANMRAAIGFCSCLLPAHAANNRRFGLIFVPQAAADSRTIFLDGSSRSACEAIPRTAGLESLDLMAKHLISLKDPAERRRYLNSVYVSVEAGADPGRAFSPVSYSSMGDSLRILKAEGSVQDLIPLWIVYSTDREKFPADDAAEIDRRIDASLNGEELQRYAAYALSDRSAPDEIFKLETSLLYLGKGHSNCTKAVWDDLSARLQRCSCRSEDIYEALSARRTPLSDLAGQEAFEQEVSVWAQKTAQERLSRELAEMEKLPGQYRSTGELRSALDARTQAFPGTVAPYVKGEVLEQCCNAVREKADRLLLERLDLVLRGTEVRADMSTAEITETLKKLQKISQMLPAGPASDGVRQNLQEKQKRLEGMLHSGDAQLRELIETVNSEPKYFTALETAAEKIGSISHERVGQVREALRRRRPQSRGSYLKEFRDTYGCSFSTSAMRGKPDFFQSVVLEDLGSYFSQPQPILLTKKDTNMLLKELYALESEARVSGYPLKVSLDGRGEEDAEAVEQVCTLKKSPKPLTGKKFTALSNELLEKGCYRKWQLQPLLQTAADLKADVKALTQRVLEGRVPDMEKEDYRRFFNDLFEVLEETGHARDKARSWIVDQSGSMQLDRDAERAVRELKKELEKKGDRKPIPRAAVAAVGGLLLAVVVICALFVFGVFPRHEKTDDRTMIIEEALEAGRQSGIVNLAGLNLSSSVPAKDGSITDDLAMIAGSLHSPSSLDLSNNGELEKLSALNGLTGIRILKLDDDIKLKPEALRELSGLGSLEYLSLCGIPDINGQLAAEIAEKNNPTCLVRWRDPGHEYVYLDGTTLLLDDPSWELPDASGLTRLSLIKDELQNLRVLSLPGADLTAEDLALLWELDNLEMLDLSDAGLQDDTVSALLSRESLGRPAALRILVLAGNPELSNRAVGQLKTALPENCYLAMSAANDVPPDNIVFIAGKVYPKGATTLDLHGRVVSAEDLELVSGMNGLTSLNLADTGISSLPDLSQLTALKELNLSGCRLKDVPGLQDLTQLSYLNLSQNALDPDNFGFPSDSLHTLILSGCGLKALPFDSAPANLETLDVSGNDFAQADLSALNGSLLKELNLADCGLNGLPSGVVPATLKILNLSGNSISELHADEALPSALVGLSLADNAEPLTLYGLEALSDLSWIDLSSVEWSWGDDGAREADLDSILRTLPNLKVLIVSDAGTQECGRIGDCLILPYYYSSEDTRAVAKETQPSPETPAVSEDGETGEDFGEAAAEDVPADTDGDTGENVGEDTYSE